MISFHNISTVARYEARTLRRSWFFRLFSLGALFILSILNIGLFSPIGDEEWQLVSISSSVPLINLYILNLGQAIVVIFLAADFLKRDKKLDTNEVLYTRPMSNLEYILGKTWGILRLFLSLDLIILSIALFVNIISRRMSVDILSYFEYLLLISVPTLVFSLGLAFLLMSAIRNQAITFLFLLGAAALDIFYLWHRVGSIFDYMAFGLPMFKSNIVGFDNLSLILNQRLFYLFLGLALVFATVLLFSRLPQSKLHLYITSALLLIFSITAFYCGSNTYSTYINSKRSKELVIRINKEYENRQFTDIIKAEIEVIHKGDSISGKALMEVCNNGSDPVDTYLFSLNPGLGVISAGATGSGQPFRRNYHIIEIYPAKQLMPGERDTVIITYAGGIVESYCYPSFSDNIKENPYNIVMVNVHKRQAFLTDEYVLLTPETHWYPVAALNYYPSNPARIKIDFTRYKLRVTDKNGLTAVSQGTGSEAGGFTSFKTETPLTGITLALGNYVKDTLIVDSVKYLSYHYPGNDYYKQDLAEIKDTLPAMISGIMRDLETNFSTPYPFSTLSLVEVPVQFHSYPMQNTQTRAEVQPSMVLLPEKLSTIDNAGFSKQFTQQKKRMARNNQVITDKELQVRLFNNFVRNTFISGENFRYVNGVAQNEPVRYRLGPSFYFFKNNFSSSEYPVINTVFESHLQKVEEPIQRNIIDLSGSLSENDRANLILKEITFRDLLKKNPAGDTIRTVVSVKGDWLFNLLRSRAGTEEFNRWFRNYLDVNKFRKVDILKLNNDVREKFGFEFYPELDNWYNRKEQPGFLFTDLRASEIVVNDRTRYQVTFIASNPGQVPGLFNISFRTANEGQEPTNIIRSGGGQITVTMQGRGMETSDIARIVYTAPGERKRIGILLDYEPRTMVVNTLFSKNIPGQLILPFNEVLKIRNIMPFEGEEQLPATASLDNPDEIIVDNEDAGFNPGSRTQPGILKKVLGINNDSRTYESLRTYNVPEYWQQVVQTNYYGRYILSAVYTRPSGSGSERSVTWSASIKKAGFYDIYTYIGKSVDHITVTQSNRQDGSGSYADNTFRDMHYRIYHDEGVEEITVDYQNAEGGWNNLGRYYLSGDTAKIEMTNQSQGRVVIADAVKWVRQE
ncbi:MAG TPA: hypothetical protein VK213_09310 [Bacteroidales bacterium]|nr:hypothetical protein [Bacteroidales bacterium]